MYQIICFVCKKEFLSKITTKEMIREYINTFDDPSPDMERMREVCDDCYAKFLEWAQKHKPEILR